MMPNAVMLFAAGLGTRMRPLTDDKPKALIPVAGRPLIDHALHPAEQAGIPTKVVNLHYKAGLLRDYLANRKVLFSNEPDQILETGGGLRHALPLLGNGPVFTMNTDAVWRGPNPYQVLSAAWGDHMDGLLLLVPPARAVGHRLKTGFAIDAAGRAIWRPDMAYTGVQILRTDGLHAIPDTVFSLRKLWDQMLVKGTLYAVEYPGKCCDVGHPAAIALAETMLDEA